MEEMIKENNQNPIVSKEELARLQAKKEEQKLPRFSYSKLSCLDHCGFCYKLEYLDKFFIKEDTLATELGTLVHYIEESIARCIMSNQPIDYEYLKNEFLNIDQNPEDAASHINLTELVSVGTENKEDAMLKIVNKTQKSSQETIHGINVLKEKYRNEFFEIDENGSSYYSRVLEYLKTGIYRLENYLKKNPQLEIYDVEHKFSVVYDKKAIFYGFIDRIFRNKETGEFIIEDIKTKNKPFRDQDLTTPLQFVFYSVGLKLELNLPDYPVSFAYDLPFCNLKQVAGTKGCITRGIKKIEKLLGLAFQPTFTPKPSALCYWCPFSHTNPKQPEEGKFKCPYFSLWRPNGSNKVFDVMNKWEGPDAHALIMKKFKMEQQGPGKDWPNPYVDFDF